MIELILSLLILVQERNLYSGRSSPPWTILNTRSSWLHRPSSHDACCYTSSRLHASSSSIEESDKAVVIKQRLFELLESAPANEPTPSSLTIQILEEINMLEQQQQQQVTTPPDAQYFLSSLAGNWELLWTTQDVNSAEYRSNNPMRRWINPLENQSYSNNPSTGRKNPILPRDVQDRLEELGVLSTPPSYNKDPPVVVSTQSIDVVKKRVRNVVRFPIFSRQGTLMVDIGFTACPIDIRRINVKFQECRLVLKPIVDIRIPLGIIGPTGWLRTSFLDHNFRITRGHKGSVFLLSRTSSSRK